MVKSPQFVQFVHPRLWRHRPAHGPALSCPGAAGPGLAESPGAAGERLGRSGDVCQWWTPSQTGDGDGVGGGGWKTWSLMRCEICMGLTCFFFRGDMILMICWTCLKSTFLREIDEIWNWDFSWGYDINDMNDIRGLIWMGWMKDSIHGI